MYVPVVLIYFSWYLAPCTAISLFLHVVLYLCLYCYLHQRLQIIDPSQALKEMGVEEHHLRFTSTISIEEEGPANKVAEKIYQLVKRYSNWFLLIYWHLMEIKFDKLLFRSYQQVPLHIVYRCRNVFGGCIIKKCFKMPGYHSEIYFDIN